MGDRQSESEFVPGMPVGFQSVPSGARPAVVAGAWVALTVLFTVGGVVAVLTVGETLGYSQELLGFVVTFAGMLGVFGAAPSVAGVVVVRTVERLEVVRDRDADASPDTRRVVYCETDERGRCRTAGPCCD